MYFPNDQSPSNPIEATLGWEFQRYYTQGTAMLLLWSSSNAMPWEPHVDIPMTYPIKHFHGIPNGQPPNASLWNLNALPIEQFHGIPNDQAPSNHIKGTWGIPHVVPIRHSHGAPMDHCQRNSMGSPCGHPNDLPIKHFHWNSH